MSVDERLRSRLAAQARAIEPDVEAGLAATLTRHRRRRTLQWAGAAGLVVAACAAIVVALTWHGNPQPRPAPARTTTVHTCSLPSAGGACLDDLRAGTYRTRLFQPAIEYTVPDGWRNDEDRAENFVLTRQGDDQTVGGGTWIGIYRNVSAASKECYVMAQPGVAQTPQALVTWFRSLPKLDVSDPQSITVGGLKGYLVDIDVARRKDEICTFDGGAAHGTPLITQSSGLHHVAAADIHVRLLILAWRSGNVTVEISSAKQLYPGRSFLDLAQPVVDSLRFTP